MLQSGILAIVRQLARSYTTGPLPEWDTFVAATAMLTLDAGQELDGTSHQAFVVVRGLVKMVDRTPEGSGRVEEFFDGISFVAPGLRPGWAEKKSAPFTLSSWRSRRWSIRPMGMVAIEDTTLMSVDYRVFEDLCTRHATWGQLHAAFLWTYIDGLTQAHDQARQPDLDLRYRDLVSRSRSFARRVDLDDMASYLGVSVETLTAVAERSRS